MSRVRKKFLAKVSLKVKTVPNPVPTSLVEKAA
jgi:hypothetical protein